MQSLKSQVNEVYGSEKGKDSQDWLYVPYLQRKEDGCQNDGWIGEQRGQGHLAALPDAVAQGMGEN
jgi:hypothetical protein